MWIAVQITIFICLVSIALILPKTIYSLLVGIGIIFTVCAVFANWLLVIQIFNILAAGGLGLKIIESRDRIFTIIYERVMRIGRDSNRYRIPKESKIPRILVIFAGIIILLCFWNIHIVHGGLQSFLIMPKEWFQYYDFRDIIRYFDFCGNVLLLFFLYDYIKRNIEVLLIPLLIKITSIGAYEVYYGINYGNWYFIINNWFYTVSFLVIFFVFLLMLNNKIKSKLPALISCIFIMITSIGLTLIGMPPFVYSDGVIALSSLVFFIAYCMIYTLLAWCLEREKVDLYI